MRFFLEEYKKSLKNKAKNFFRLKFFALDRYKHNYSFLEILFYFS